MTAILNQFIGATVTAVGIKRIEDGAGLRFNELALDLKLADGTTRELTVYSIDAGYEDPKGLCFRVDGMYVPDEDLDR